MKMSYVLLTCIAIFSFGLYTSWKHIVEWHVVLSHCQFQLEIARVNVATQIRLRLSQGTPFLSVPEMVLQSGPWTPPLLQLGFHLLQFRCQREDRPLPNCLCERLCSICIYLTNIWYNLQIGHKLQVRKSDVQISSLWVSFFHIPYSSTLRYDSVPLCFDFSCHLQIYSSLNLTSPISMEGMLAFSRRSKSHTKSCTMFSAYRGIVAFRTSK